MLRRTLILIQCIAITSARNADPPTPANDDKTAEEMLEICTPWGKAQFSIKNKDGSFTYVPKIPWDLLCSLSPHDCLDENGNAGNIPAKEYRNLMLDDIGLYGLNSLRKPAFARLIPFITKKNHSDDTEAYVNTGCHGTMHPDSIPDEPWIALIKRGDCYFTEKLQNAVHTHGAKGFIVYNNDDVGNPEVIMNITTTGLTTIMVNQSVGENLDLLHTILNLHDQHVPDHNLTYTKQIYTNITFDHCATNKSQQPVQTPVPVTVVTITFVVVMIIALAWLVVYYFQKHRNANKQMMLQLKLQKAAKKALKKIGERVIKDTDEEADIDNQQDCTYCLDPLIVGDTIRHLPCKHKFHKECVDEWLIHNRTCPNCHSNILLATGVTIRGIKPTADDEEVAVEMTDMAPDSRRQLLSDSQAIAGHEDESDSQGFGSQMIPGSQLLTDGQNMFLYVPNDVVLPTDTTIQIENPPLQLQMSQQLMEDQRNLLSGTEDSKVAT